MSFGLRTSIFILVFSLAFNAWALPTLRVVKNNMSEANFVVFEDNNDGVARYKKAIWLNKELRGFAPVTELDQRLNELKNSDQKLPRVLLLANASTQDSDRHRLEHAFIRPFKKMGAEVYMLPMAATEGLNPDEKKEFLDLLSLHFDLMISNGGDDIEPSLYQEKITYSVDTNGARDRAEGEVIRGYIERARGFFYGVCRGMQLAAVAFGMKMYQDIPKELGDKVAHGGQGFRFHDIHLNPTRHSVLKNMVGGAEVINGFSWHHQAVKYTPNAIFQIAGSDIEGQFPEALESVNGKVLLTQFHPEYSRRVDAVGGKDNGEWGVKILQGIFAKAKSIHDTKYTRACHNILLRN